MSSVDDEQIWLLETNQRIDEMRGVLISAEEWRTKQFSEMKEMLSSMINQLRPPTYQEQGARSIPSGMEQITRSSSLLADTQMNLKLEELELVEAKGDPDVAEKHLNPVAHQVFDEMPMLGDKEIKLSDAFPKEFEVLLDDTLDQEASPLSLDEEKDGSVEGSVLPYFANELSNSSMAFNVPDSKSSVSLMAGISFSDLRLEWEVKSISRVLEFSKKLGINGYAHKVFEEMTEKKFVLFGLSAVLNHDALRVIHVVDGKWVLIFDPGGLFCVKTVMIGTNMNKNTHLPSTNIHELEFDKLEDVFYHHFEATGQGLISAPYDRGKMLSLACCLESLDKGICCWNVTIKEFSCRSAIGAVLFGLKFIKDDKTSMPFDRGRIYVAQAALFGLKLFKEARVVFGNGCCFSPCVIASLYGKILVFDPGIPKGRIAIKSVLKCNFVQLNQLGRQPRWSYLWSNGSRFIKHICLVVICCCCYGQFFTHQQLLVTD